AKRVAVWGFQAFPQAERVAVWGFQAFPQPERVAVQKFKSNIHLKNYIYDDSNSINRIHFL
ncbi:MAG: hypothetical protein UHS50_02290, partial [Bacteroidaceae bacterium]|nr:hypothetical protein [Bacteroidaceae bacterium]